MNNTLVILSPLDLSLAAGMVLALAALSRNLKLGLEGQLLIAAVRTVVQLGLIGLVLKALFDDLHPAFLIPISLMMLLAAGREVIARQKHKLRGGFVVGSSAMFVSAFSITLFSLLVVVQPEPWYQPQYAIPLLGMMLGNTMTGITIGMERLTSTLIREKALIEQRLMLGHTAKQAVEETLREAARAGMIPIINAMAAAGIVSLPGMMTGQILAGSPPMAAVSYQILIMFMVTAGTGFGTLLALKLTAKRLFDERDRLRLDRLHT
jgi:putative ABC transport system permease protein